MTTRWLALCSTALCLMLAGRARPALAAKRVNFAHGASCQPKKVGGVVPMLSYTNAGVLVDSSSAELICPIPWSKEGLSTWELLDKVDVSVDWLGLPSGATPPTTPTWGCNLVYESPGGTLYTTPLPVTYPLPPYLSNVAYAALWCAAPQTMGIQGYSINMCFVASNNPGGCAPP
jgi:hypothetical protein